MHQLYHIQKNHAHLKNSKRKPVNLRAIARNRGIAGEPGGLRGEITPLKALLSIVCCTVIVCLKSEGKLILDPGSFLRSFNLDLLNFPRNIFLFII